MMQSTPNNAETSVDSAASPPIPTESTSVSMTDQLFDAYQSFSEGNWTEASSMLLLKVALPSLLALLAIIVLYLFAKLLSRWTSRLLSERFDRTIGYFGGQLVFYAITLFASLAILQTLGVGITAFAAVLGAMGLAIGLALQGTLSNFASGVLLLVFRPFKAGDMVQTAGVLGKVFAIELFTTTFDTPDNRRLIVPNSSIVGATIENISFHKERRVEVIIGVDYSARMDKTRDVLLSCSEAVSDLLIEGEGRGFSVILANLGPSSVDWKVRGWTARENFFAMQEALTEEIKRRLDQHGLQIPFPQMQLHVSQSARSKALTEGLANSSGGTIRDFEATLDDAERAEVAVAPTSPAFARTDAPTYREVLPDVQHGQPMRPAIALNRPVRPRSRSGH
ncbi:MAG: mechanosensitive ion channel [bacterium]|nr:mechanosensitive ion channel [bacterium]